MAVATWRVLAFGALLGSVALPAVAQVVIGGSGQPSVEVNWAVLDSLGRQPTLPDLLLGKTPAPAPQATAARGRSAASAVQGVQFHPYKPPKAKVAKVSHHKPAAVPAVAKAEPDLADSPVAKIVQAAQKTEVTAPVAAPKTEKAELPKSAAQPALPPAPQVAEAAPPAGPKVDLPETPKPAAVPAPAAAVPAKVEPEAAKSAAPVAPAAEKTAAVAPAAEKVVAAATAPSVPPTALTPPPPAPAPPAPAPQEASLPAVPAPVPMAVVSSKGDTLSVVFGNDSSTLPGAAGPELDKLVKRLRKEDTLGLQLLAFADGDEAHASKARRLSLSRALEVRKYLMEQGVRSTRIEVRALGNKLEGSGPADRVDAVLVNR